ncbi:hypothetical protein GCM10010441_50970 [Kitasatospora paracochleata]|uniref:DNA primase/polymerase bifunctional N-terminal domain-containing protein n=1 Tax=Kitasatospora paracochleata TaxID=58354 RepID=A0ABT1IS26_9ACTN|nr:hypothetical protein [Kitasatospora paracochleata]MCP2307799.1 hypothetical protein [Kitasatospora paracochleata]
MESTHRSGALRWLAEAAADPESCLRTWQSAGLEPALLPAGRRWDVLLVPAPLGLHALAALGRLHGHGPVYTDPDRDDLGFLVPVGTADHWIATGIRAVGTGTPVGIPHPDRRHGHRWLVLPEGDGRLVDPALLALALHDAAATLRRER